MILLRRLRITAFKQLLNVSLEFPRRGSILVEGANEAGKSTLFEAIYFALYGRPLVGEDERPSLEDVIPHDGDTAGVSLHLSSGDVTLEIRRTVSRGRAGSKGATQKVVLRVARPGEAVEEISTTRAADDCIERELHGLNGDTLRNSCFMEQKALDRIESLDRERREASVARLLGIGEIQKIERSLERTAQARSQQVAQSAAECEVAEARLAAAAAERLEAEARERCRAAQVRALVAARDRQTGDTEDSLRAESDTHAARTALEARLHEAARLHALIAEATAAGGAVERVRQAEHDAAEARAALDALDRLERDDLPPLHARLEALSGAGAALAARAAARARLDALERASTALTSAAATTTAEAEAQRALAGAQAEAARLTTGDALARWARLKETETRIREGVQRDEALARQRDALASSHAVAVARARRTLLPLVVLALLASVAGIVGVFWHPAWLVAVLLLLACAVAGRAAFAARAAARSANVALAQATRAAEAQRAAHAAARQLAGLLDDLPRLERDLRAAGVSLPAAAGAISSLPASETSNTAIAAAQRTVEDAQRTLERSRVASEAASARVGEALAEVAALSEDPASGNVLTLYSALGAESAPDTLREALSAAHAALAAAESALQRQTRALDVAPDAASLAAARGAAQQEVDRLGALLAGREEATVACAARESARHEALAAAAASVSALRDQARETGLDIPTGTASRSLPPDTTDSLAADLERLAAVAEARLTALDEQGARVALGRMDERLVALARTHESAALSSSEQIVRIRAALAEQGIAADGTETLAALAVRWPVLATLDAQDADALEQALRSAQSEAHHQRERATELARKHALDDIALDVEECRQRRDTLQADLRRHQLAVTLAQSVRARIVRRVIPETAVYMRSLLPELTAGRYRDVRLQSSDDEGADLSVRVWDQLAGRYVKKNLFSGGTRDQCSLALRLAFALATLPKELGAMPGFIFLDEPLSSFDAERSRALVHVLTRGAIAQQFAQVVLISHSQSFERDSLRYHVRMAGGRIAASNLPSEREAAALWDAEAAIAEQTV